jgi:hypothetical protein
MAAAILFECIALPFLLVTDNLRMRDGLQMNEIALRVGTVIEVACIMDLVINMNTGYVDKGVIVMDRGRIARNYLRSGSLIFDLVIVSPVFIVVLHLLHRGRVDLLPDQISFYFLCTLKMLKFYKLHTFETRVSANGFKRFSYLR